MSSAAKKPDGRTKIANQGPTPDLKTEAMGLVWRAAIELGTFTGPELAEAAGVPIQTVTHMVTRWEIEGYFWRRGLGSRGGHQFELVSEQKRPYGPKEQRIWQTMRKMRTFSVADIVGLSSLPNDPVQHDEVEAYIHALLNADYMRIRVKAKSGESSARYQLVKDTGPRPPFKRRVYVLIDPNLGEGVLPKDYRR